MKERNGKAIGYSKSKRKRSGNKVGFKIALLSDAYGAVAAMVAAIWAALNSAEASISIASGIFGFAVTVIAAILTVMGYVCGKDRGGYAMSFGVALGGGCSNACIFNKMGSSTAIAFAVFLCVPIAVSAFAYCMNNNRSDGISGRLRSVDLAAAVLSLAVAIAVAFFASDSIITGNAAFGNIYVVFFTVLAAGAIYSYLLIDERSPIDAAAFVGGAFIFIIAMTADINVVCVAAAVIVIICLYPLTFAAITAMRGVKLRAV